MIVRQMNQAILLEVGIIRSQLCNRIGGEEYTLQLQRVVLLKLGQAHPPEI